MSRSDKHKELSKFLETKLVVIEVHDGETQEEAWHRHLTLHPECANTHIKIFHYPAKKTLDQAQGDLRLAPVKPSGGKFHV